jgi:N-hydroxyarylamine O-acetyltransferase
MQNFDLKKYFKRIHYHGDIKPNLEVLNAITLAHAQSIPFENIDVFLDKGIQLDPDLVFEKLVTNKRGGYCFEQNSLLLRALEAIGFNAKPLSARVRLRFTDREPIAPRTHIFIRVDLDNHIYLTDVGMGSASLTQALKLELDVEQETSHDIRRIVKEGTVFYHQIRYTENWRDACEFTLEEMPAIDREIANWYTSAHPQSHFRDRLVASRALENGERLSLENFDLNLRSRNGEAQKSKIENNEKLIEVFKNQFGLLLSDSDCEKLNKKRI